MFRATENTLNDKGGEAGNACLQGQTLGVDNDSYAMLAVERKLC